MINENEVKANVVSLFDRQRKVDEIGAEVEPKELDFMTIMKKNRDAKERMKKDRNKSNRSVLRSYRLK